MTDYKTEAQSDLERSWQTYVYTQDYEHLDAISHNLAATTAALQSIAASLITITDALTNPHVLVTDLLTTADSVGIINHQTGTGAPRGG